MCGERNPTEAADEVKRRHGLYIIAVLVIRQWSLEHFNLCIQGMGVSHRQNGLYKATNDSWAAKAVQSGDDPCSAAGQPQAGGGASHCPRLISPHLGKIG